MHTRWWISLLIITRILKHSLSLAKFSLVICRSLFQILHRLVPTHFKMFWMDYLKNAWTWITECQIGLMPTILCFIFNADIRDKIMPGVTHWQSPGYFAYFPSNSSIAGFLGEMLSAGVNVVGFSWITSPAATELETIVMDWLGKALKLPDAFLSTGHGGGVIQGTASEAVLVVLLAARDKILRKVGEDAIRKLVVYISDQTHASLQKACKIGGIFPQNIRILETDSSTEYALSPESLTKTISQDIALGLIPFFLCATIGTTSSTAVDPLLALGKIAKSNGLWFHVDAAYAGSACICPEFRPYLDGVEEADSFNMNAHKLFLTNFDCSALWVKERNALIQSLSTKAEYLENKAYQENMVVDYKDWQIPLGRRFRSLKLWMVFRLYGLENLQVYIRNRIELARKFEDLVKNDARFEVLSNKYILRFAVGAPLTEERHIFAAWEMLQEKAYALLKRM
ncbi:tyrosine decarboxylase 2 isoform X3 [Primulina tabacum]|uniref:tyrosine decarboxylase 2 isoform X3 n=1 Tax=Primulina tabacum TaxID=48773 RepID=UPI003F5A25EB